MAMGYAGYGKIDTTFLLLTSCGINPELNPISSNAALGFGWKNAADVAFYANGIRDYRGSIGFDLDIKLWGTLNEWALTKRIYAKDFEHSPDGTVVYKYDAAVNTLGTAGAWCESMSISTSADSTIQTSLNVLALERTVTTNASMGYVTNDLGTTGGAVLSCAFMANFGNSATEINNHPIPFWMSKAQLFSGSSELDTNVNAISWSVDVSNNTQIIKACNGGTQVDNYGVAAGVVCGPMSVTGNIELYGNDGIFDPVATKEILASTHKMVVTIDDNTITIPAIRLESDDYSLNLSGPATRRFNFKGIGGKCDGAVLAPMIMA